MEDDESWLAPQLRTGAHMEINIPMSHPWFEWLNDYQHEAMDNGGLMRHGVLTLNLGGIEQRYDLVEIDSVGSRGDISSKTTWRMYGAPDSAGDH